MRTSDKQIKAQFNRSADHRYDANAKVQPRMADALLSELRTHFVLTLPDGSNQPPQILEIGCGTGALTLQLAQQLPPSCRITAVDLAPGMLEAARGKLNKRCPHTLDRVRFVEANAEQGDLLPEWHSSYALIASNACFQWFNRPVETIRSLQQLLAPAGILAFATFGPRTMHELHASFQAAYAKLNQPYRHHGLTFHSIEQWTALLAEAGLQVVHASSYEETELHPTPAAFLHAVKAVGAGASEAGEAEAASPPAAGIQRRLFREMFKAYEQHFPAPSGEGVAATYEVLIFIAKPDEHSN
ncbi:Methyltransferase type 12 [Paenibacillus curdlanolyticus YK9]|uniref:Malonyl-[acyl-carrier protein] O-methyltransferase n=1 Tax=Paenibacillus curdlanolyticus YK9 TaxID=717606 RepID=E0I6S7_9BACL|nr:methyltransferase [Paenibacillus curdlanolyticus]EFM11743.1 Methyltransferase type 12 [Paenibacillus curdlanolyticus YK9]